MLRKGEGGPKILEICLRNIHGWFLINQINTNFRLAENWDKHEHMDRTLILLNIVADKECFEMCEIVFS